MLIVDKVRVGKDMGARERGGELLIMYSKVMRCKGKLLWQKILSVVKGLTLVRRERPELFK